MALSLWAHGGGKTLLSLQLSCPNKAASVNSVDATKLWANAKNTQLLSFSPSSLRPDLSTSQSRGTGHTTPDSLNTFPVYFFSFRQDIPFLIMSVAAPTDFNPEKADNLEDVRHSLL
jgi:hypothetical protein